MSTQHSALSIQPTNDPGYPASSNLACWGGVPPITRLSSAYNRMEISTLTVASTRTAIAEKQFTATRLVEDFYKKIKAEDGDVHAYLTLAEDRAFAQAKRVDDAVAKGGPLPPLAGVPIAIKDVMVTRGVRSTAGSKVLENFIPPYDC